VDNPPERIIFKSLEVLAKITVKVSGEDKLHQQRSPQATNSRSPLSGFHTAPPAWAAHVDNLQGDATEDEAEFPMTDANVCFALDILHPTRRMLKSRDREVFAALIQLHSYNHQLLADLSRVIAYMCRLQPPEFVFVSFAVELDRFVRRLQKQRKQEAEKQQKAEDSLNAGAGKEKQRPLSRDLEFVSSFVQQMSHVLLNAEEAKPLRDTLRDCVGFMQVDVNNPTEHRRVRLFHILLHSFSHSMVATVSLCLWGGAYRTAAAFLGRIVPLDVNLVFLCELDKLVELLERPLFRHLHVRMLERNEDPSTEWSGFMLFKTLKFLLMIIPRSTCYKVLKDRLVSISRFRQSTGMMTPSLKVGTNHHVNEIDRKRLDEQTEVFVARVLKVRAIHCDAMWQAIRSDSLECEVPDPSPIHEEGESRRLWLGYASKEEQQKAEERYRREKLSQQQIKGLSIEEIGGYTDLCIETSDSAIERQLNHEFELDESEYDMPCRSREVTNPQTTEESKDAWKAYWADD
jgi:Vacuolar protein 14 C-terminal Fig4p binding